MVCLTLNTSTAGSAAPLSFSITSSLSVMESSFNKYWATYKINK